jgi:hypothetical protein
MHSKKHQPLSRTTLALVASGTQAVELAKRSHRAAQSLTHGGRADLAQCARTLRDKALARAREIGQQLQRIESRTGVQK